MEFPTLHFRAEVVPRWMGPSLAKERRRVCSTRRLRVRRSVESSPLYPNGSFTESPCQAFLAGGFFGVKRV